MGDKKKLLASDLVKVAEEWTHLNETIVMIGLAVAQIEKSLHDGDSSVDILTSSFTRMIERLDVIKLEFNKIPSIEEIDNILSLDDKEEMKKQLSVLKENMLENGMDVHNVLEDITSKAKDEMMETIVAFQFYDRLSQRLHQIVGSLTALSHLITDQGRVHNPYEWVNLQEKIKSKYTIEADRIMFDALLAGVEIEQAIEIAGSYEKENEKEEDSIELF